MLDLLAVMQSMCAGVSAQGLPATVDERDLNPPALLLRPPELSWRFQQGRYDAAWTAVICVNDAGRTASLAALGPLLEQAAAGLGVPVLGGRPVDLLLPDQAGPLPAYEITFNTKIVL